MDDLTRWIVGAAAAALIGAVARRARWLTLGGAIAATIVGTLAVGAGWSWGVLVIAYFVSASVLSRYRAAERVARVGGMVAKDGPRDAAQVAANGGVFVLSAIGYLASPDPLWQGLAVAALAASAADTWATEIGTLARATPRSIIDWSIVPPGTSGGVTLHGTLAALAGALFLGLLAWLVRWPHAAVVAAIGGGVFGCVLDSWLGATVQGRRRCEACGTATEMRVHSCGTATRLTGGWRWLDNDGVNAVSTLGGALFGAASSRFF